MDRVIDATFITRFFMCSQTSFFECLPLHIKDVWSVKAVHESSNFVR